MNGKLSVLLSIFLLVNVSIAQESSKEYTKAQKRQAQFEWANQLIEDGRFRFKTEWMVTAQGRRIQMDRGRSYMNIIDGNAKGYFPYVGIKRMSVASGNGGVEFDDEIRDYEVSIDAAIRLILVEFRVSNKGEDYQMLLRLKNGSSGTLNVTSNARDRISYEGWIEPIKD